MELKILTDPLRANRRARDLYFPVSSAMGEMMMSKLAYQSMILGAPEISVTSHRKWWIFRSSIDWIAARPQPASEVFTAIVPCPEDGPNSHRYEIVVAAFADAYVSIGKDGEKISRGDVEGILGALEKDRLRFPDGRVLAVRLDE